MQVLDASFTIPLFIPDSRSDQIEALLRTLREEGHTMLAPTLWTYEVTSTIQKMRHFGQITASEVEDALETIAVFKIDLVQPELPLVRSAIAWSQRLHRASTYDSFYLALAQDRGCELWPADSRLANAVNESWVRLLA
jgi:predicted nucleic acid-binding protein